MKTKSNTAKRFVLLLFVAAVIYFSTGTVSAQLLTNNYLFFNENRTQQVNARNWAIRQNNSNEGDFQIGTINLNESGLPDFFTNPSLAALTINRNRNVGIGTTTPSFKLDVMSSNSLDGMQLLNTNGKWLRLYTPSLTGGAFNSITVAGDAGILFGDLTGGLNSVNYGLVIAPHRSSVSGLRITPNGDVGIGVSDTRGYKLAVGGRAIAEEVVIKLQGNWPDYVFDRSYNLTPIATLKQFIAQNNHLPDVPAAATIEANGVAVGEMNAILLKKVEELTLYIIAQHEASVQQQEALKVIRAELDALKKK